MVVDGVDRAEVAPAPEVVVDGLPRRERVGEHPPLDAALDEVEDSVEDEAEVMGVEPLAGEERCDSLPLGVRQVGAVAS